MNTRHLLVTIGGLTLSHLVLLVGVQFGPSDDWMPFLSFVFFGGLILAGFSFLMWLLDWNEARMIRNLNRKYGRDEHGSAPDL